MITPADIEAVFTAQLSRIEDEKLRRQVIEVWVLAAREGGWESIAQLRALPFTLLTDTRGVNFIEHTVAVTEGACALAEAQSRSYARMPYPVNFDRLIAGGLLHDVGKLVESQPDGKGGYTKSRAGQYARHPISGAILAARCELAADVINTIACHAREGEGAPKVLETVLIHQADYATFDPLVMLNQGQLII